MRTTILTVALVVVAACGCGSPAGGELGCGAGGTDPCVCDDGREGTRPCEGGACDCGPGSLPPGPRPLEPPPREPGRSGEIRGPDEASRGEPGWCRIRAPASVDLGTVPPECLGPAEAIELVNVGCPEPVRFGRAWIEQEGAVERFFLRRTLPPGTVLPPGEPVALEVAFRAVAEGEERAVLHVEVEGATVGPIPLLAHGAMPEPVIDTFHRAEQPKVDVLVVIDNGTSMAAWADVAETELLEVFDRMAWEDLDYHLGVTTTGIAAAPGAGCPGGAEGGEDGRLFPVDGTRPRVVTPATPDGRAVFAANLRVGACHAAPPQGFEAALRVVTPPLSASADDPRHPEPDDGNLDFLRPDAHLRVIVVSDRADASPREPVAYHVDFMELKGFRNTHLFNFDAVTGDRGTGCASAGGATAAPGDRLVEEVERTEGGRFASICRSDWHLAEYGGVPLGFPRCYFLGDSPADVDGDGGVDDRDLEVRVEGVVVPAAGADGLRNWTFDPGLNAVCFERDRQPPWGGRVDVTYFPACLTD